MSDKEEAVDNPEQEVEIGNYKIINLARKAPVEEDKSETLFKARSKIYIWDKESKEWKERGLGNISVVKEEKTGKIKIVHVQEQTFKLRAFFYVYGEKMCLLKKMETVKNAFCFTCIDYSDDVTKPAIRQFGIRFNKEEEFNKFQEVVEESRKQNNLLEQFKQLNLEEQKENEETPKCEKKHCCQHENSESKKCQETKEN